MLTVELKLDKDAVDNSEVEIYCDHEGLICLIERLTALAKNKGPDHVHLMTPSWAGQELTEEPKGEGTKLLHHLVIAKE